jgi:hypothetical protein
MVRKLSDFEMSVKNPLPTKTNFEFYSISVMIKMLLRKYMIVKNRKM